MTFEEFRNNARLYVIGALYPDELDEFEQAATSFGAKARSYIRDCCELRDAFALSLRPPTAQQNLRGKVSAMLRGHQAGGLSGPAQFNRAN